MPDERIPKRIPLSLQHRSLQPIESEDGSALRRSTETVSDAGQDGYGEGEVFSHHPFSFLWPRRYDKEGDN